LAGILMSKPSIYKRLYKSTIILFTLFILFLIGINIFLSYQNFLDAKRMIPQEILKTKKKILKNEIDFIVSEIEPTLIKEKETVHRNIKEQVLTAYNIATNLYQKNKNNPDIKEIIKESLRELKFNELGDQFVFMTKLDGTFILNPGFPRLEGKNVFDLQNEDNINSFQEIIKMVQEKKEGYHRYEWQNHRNLMFEKKVSYFKYFKPFDCYIGTGVFDSDIDHSLKKKFIEKIESYRIGEKNR
jgi:signal transduction histidine kinase